VFVLIMGAEIVWGFSLLILFVALGIRPRLHHCPACPRHFCLPFVTVTVLARLNGFDRPLVEARAGPRRASCRPSHAHPADAHPPSPRLGCFPSRCPSDDVIITTFVAGPGLRAAAGSSLTLWCAEGSRPRSKRAEHGLSCSRSSSQASPSGCSSASDQSSIGDRDDNALSSPFWDSSAFTCQAASSSSLQLADYLPKEVLTRFTKETGIKGQVLPRTTPTR